MLKDKLPNLLFILTLLIFLFVSALYLQKSTKKNQPQGPGTEVTGSVGVNKAPVITEPEPLPPKIFYTITEVKTDVINAKTDKGEASFSKDFMEAKGIYKMVDGKKQDFTFSDLTVGQKIIAHTEEGTTSIGFELID